jgi:nucleoid-associated protein YgaU
MDTKKLPFNLKIIPINTSGFPIGIPFIAMFNPDSFAINEEIEWAAQCPPGKQGSDFQYKRTNPRKFTIEFMLDGTGVNTNGIKIPVTAQIALFRATTTGVRGTVHRPDFLLVQYGPFINTCVLNSSSVTYTMFDVYGLPIRAKVSASFTERTIEVLGDILGMLSSPDLTHKVVVKEGDILPLLTHRIYNNQNYYLQVARVNKLKNFRKLKAGTVLVFPPISDK